MGGGGCRWEVVGVDGRWMRHQLTVCQTLSAGWHIHSLDPSL